MNHQTKKTFVVIIVFLCLFIFYCFISFLTKSERWERVNSKELEYKQALKLYQES